MNKILMVLSVLLLAGCAARKKDVQKSVAKFDFRSELDSLVNRSVKFELQKTAAQYLRETARSTNFHYDGKKGDTLSVDQFGPDGVIISRTVISGSGKADISQHQTESQRSSEEKVTAAAHEDLHTTVNKNDQGELLNESVDKHVQTTGFSWLTFLWLLILPLLWLLWRYRKQIKTRFSI